MAIDMRNTTSGYAVIGPFISEADGITRVTNLTIQASDIRLCFGGVAANAVLSGSVAHAFAGHYTVPFTDNDMIFPGPIQVVVLKTGCLPVFATLNVLSQQAYDVKYLGNVVIPVNVKEIDGSAVVSSSGQVCADIRRVNGVNIPANGDGLIPADTRKIGATDVEKTGSSLNVNITKVLGTAVSASSGLMDVNASRIGGSVPVQSSGILSANITHIGGTVAPQTNGQLEVLSGDLNTKITAVNNNVLSIQNNTTFTASVVSEIELPIGEGGFTWVPISIQIRDEKGVPVDADTNECSIQVRYDYSSSSMSELYTTRAGTTQLTGSSLFGVGYYKTTRVSAGIYEAWMKVLPSVAVGTYTITFKYNKASVTQQYTRNFAINNEQTPLSVELSGSTNNMELIARALRGVDSHSFITVSGSIYSDIVTRLQGVVDKLPTGTISDMSLDSLVEGVPVRKALSLLMAMVDGRIVKDLPLEGDLTFYERDNDTIATIVRTTEAERIRVDLV